MAQLSNILALERERATIGQCRQIHLHLEGQFYHIYEWSAWLFTRYVLAYPIEQKSPMETMSFMMELKSRIAKII